jgi:O-antigen/teichoic acid export membrane protein
MSVSLDTAVVEQPRTLKQRFLAGASWTIVGYGAQNVLRLGSNLILTRILDPGAFGLMALATIFITGLELLSDVGVGPAIIQSKRGDDQQLLDTAWTIQIIRGFILFGFCLIVSWPAARYYATPSLGPLVAVTGLGLVVRGFTPTRVHALNRKVLLGRLTVVDLGCQVFSLLVTVTACWMWRSVWGLVVGTLAGDLCRVVLSFAILPGHRHHLSLDRTALHDLVHVGRWIIVSTAVTFAAGNLDRLLMGKWLSVTELGIYSIAFQMVGALTGVGRSIGSRVMFPILAETARMSREMLYERLRKGRLLWLVPTVAGLLLLSIWGDVLIRHLYKANYHEAGWMLRILAAGAIVATINQTTGIAWPSLGDFRLIAVFMAVQVPVLVAAMYLGRLWYGTPGLVVGIAAVELLMWPLESFLVQKRHKLWQPEIDLPCLAMSAVVVALGAVLHR